ncbi:hypothetical protein [Parvibaculum sp.]|uniref:hypothetical protein n=1 Tax=Parvibaculum sp. TaxID=2024848 RepID=UPI003BAB01EA
MSTEQRRSSRLSSIVALLAGFFLVACSLPAVIGQAIALADGGAAAAVLRSGAALSDDDLAVARKRYGRATRWQPLDSDLAFALARLDLRAGLAGDDAALQVALGHFRGAAALAPNYAFVWSQLARAAAAQDAPAGEVASYLRLSYLLGRFEAPSMLARTPVAIAYWDELPEEQREATRQDLRRLYPERRFIQGLGEIYLSLGYRERVIFLDAAFEDADQRRRFVRYVLSAAGLKDLRKVLAP